MQKAQRIIKTYRRNRMIVCTICALVTLASTLSVRFISQRNLNQQRVVQFANHAVEELDKVLLPLQAGSEVLLPLIGLPCSVAHLPLRKQAAKLQTVRSIGLVQDSRITDQTGKEHVTTVQTILDQLMPGLVPLLLTFACMWLLRKKVNPLWIIVGFFVIGIAGYACGLLGL
ncbi:TPA: hypothetical protein GW990_06745 [Escherichia coli]|nr:hypothetical protein [Escherichia coli]